MDLLHYFKNLIEIDDKKTHDYAIGISEEKLGGYFFERNTQTNLLLRFCVYPDNQCVIQSLVLN